MDAIITYVDITDKFIKSYKTYCKKELNENRFRSYGVLDLQVKGIRKYMPYVNNIFIVVSDKEQVEGIDLNGCTIITHDMIIPKKYLPCFNSCTIEMFLYKIPDLSEEFIYFNDDIFVINDIPEKYWFIKHKPNLWVDSKDFDKEDTNIYHRNLYNSTRLISEELKYHSYKNKYLRFSHSARPFLKSSCERVFNKHILYILNSLTRTRHSKNLNMTLFNCYDYFSLNYNKVDKNYSYFDSYNINDIVNIIYKKEKPIICINDNDNYIDFDEFKTELRNALEANLKGKKYVREINKEKINITDKLIVSFTSWTKRIQYCKHTIDLMMNQTVKPDKIILNLSEEEFPNKENDLPKDLIKEYKVNNRFEIYWVKENTTVWKKIIPTMNRFPNDLVFSIDDDIEYPSNYIEEMYKTYCENNKLYPVVGYEHFIDNELCHSGPFTLTAKKFYDELLNKTFEELIKPSNKKWASDIVYFKVAQTLGYKYILCNKINGNSIYKNSELNKENKYSIWNKEYKDQRKEDIKKLDEYIRKFKKYEDGISICISAYKATKYIKETLNSVAIQTWFTNHNNWECNIGIDGCKETLEYIKLIMNEFDPNHFHFYYMHENKGTYITSNTLMSKISKYNYVIRFDSDDIMHSNMIETIVNNIDDKTDIIRFNLQNFADAEYTLGDIEKIKKSYISYGQICIKHIKFDRYGGYLPWKCSADAEFLARTRRFLKQKKLSDVLFDRRITNESLTNSKKTNNKSELRKQYDEHINTISVNVKNRNDAINKDIEINSYIKVIPYELIISLTSYPDRIKFVKSVLESIVNTSVNKSIYKLIVVLAEEEFKHKEGDLPTDLVSYCNENNIEILWTYRNIRSHKKLIPVIKKYPSCPILVIDDDIIRNEEWLKMFINDRRKYPEDILTMRCDDYITKNFECIHDRTNFELGVKFEDLIYHNRPSNGCGGTLYPPYTFRDKIFFNEDLFMKLSPSSDEMWQFCFNIMNNQRIRRTSNIFNVEPIKGSQKLSLYKENKGKYTLIMNSLLNYFPLFKENLIKRINLENELNIKNYKGVISLTSWRKRINTCHKTIYQLLNYTKNKFKVVLTLSIEEFPNKEIDLPNELINLLNKYKNFEILWVYKNYKVFKKILFTMQKYKDLPIISADDDIIYKYDYINELYDNWLTQQNNIISEGYEIKYTLYNEIYKFSKGCATIFPPSSLLGLTKYLNNDIINTQNDDSLYGIYAHLNNIKIVNMHNNINSLIENHTNNDAITVTVKTSKDFYNDKLLIYTQIKEYKEL